MQAMEALKQSEKKYKALIETTDTGYLILDSQGKVTDANNEYLRLTGHKTLDEIIGRRVVEWTAEHDRERNAAEVTKCLQQGYVRGLEIDYVDNEGRITTVEINGTVLSMGESLQIVSLCRDITKRKQAEVALEKNRELLGLVMDSLPVAIVYVDSEHRFVLANHTFKSWWGKPDKDLLGLAVREVLGSHYTMIQGYLERALTGEEVRYESSVKNGDGVMRDISVVLVPDRAADGAIRGLACLISDISERKRHEEELVRIRSAVDGASDAIAMATLEGEHFYQNRTFGDIFGYKIEDLRGPDGIFKAFKDRAAARVLFENIQQGLSWATEIEMLAKDGRCFPVYVRADAIRDDQGERTTLIGIMTDVTKLRQVEHALNKSCNDLLESQRRFATLFEAAQDCMFIKDRELRYVEVNQAVVDFCGRPRSEIIGKTDKGLFRSEYYRHTADIESRVLQDQVIENQETLVLKSQSTNWSILRFPLKEASDEVIGICGIAREMDDQAYYDFDSLVDTDEARYPSLVMRSTLAKAAIASKTSATILLTGETGSGKDHLAQYIHDCSPDTVGPLLVVNCAAIPSELAESELFGHEAGAFTGGYRRKRGLLELAEGGTLLLNEIGELSLALQAKLLTFLDTFSFTRVGGEKLITARARVIAATSKDLDKEISQGHFRKELFYRLNVFPIHVPALRERLEDIPLLAEEIVSEFAHLRAVSPNPTIHVGVLDMFGRYSWPGNVRELKNILERALILSKGGPIKINHTSLSGTQATVPFDEISHKPLKSSLNEIVGKTERSLIEEALRNSNGNKQGAARILGISRFTLARHINKLGIDER